VRSSEIPQLRLEAFDFKKEGLHDDIKACKMVEGKMEEGLVISHAGMSFFTCSMFRVTDHVLQELARSSM
jgi:hypothetical protein